MTMIAIVPFTSALKNVKAVGQPFFVATGFTIDFVRKAGIITGAIPSFTDPNGSVLPNGAVPLIGFPGSTPTALQASESTDIARAMFEAGPGADPDAAAAAVVVKSRGVVLVSSAK